MRLNTKKRLEKIKFDSKIINNIDDSQFIVNELIEQEFALKSNINKFNLIYRATQDGDDADSFYRKVENKRKILFVIKTTNGSRFGCYLDIAIKRSNGETKDEKSFVYSFDKKKIYKKIPGVYCINNGSDILNLYDQPICIKNKFLSNKNSYTEEIQKIRSFSGFEKNYEINKNEKNFMVEEMEVFQIN